MPNSDGEAERDELDDAQEETGMRMLLSKHKVHADGTPCTREGCTNTIAGRPMRTRYCLQCAQQLRNFGHRRRDPNRPSHACPPRPRGSEPAPIRKPRSCFRCCDMPWARMPDRESDQIGGSFGMSAFVGVAQNGGWLCTGCGKPWAPEPKPDIGTCLSSSAGTTESAAAIYGASPLRGNKTSFKKKEGNGDV